MRLLSALLALTLIAGPAAAQDGASAAARMGEAAQAFLATLTDDQRARVRVSSLEDDATRAAWSNLPAALYARDGAPLADLSDAQRFALHELLAASLSGQGYLKAAQIMWSDDILHGIGQERLARLRAEGGEGAAAGLAPVAESWGALNYWVRIYGDPGDGRWAWSLNGHHLALNFTVVDGRVASTPMFLGAEPEIVESGRYAGWRALPQQTRLALELMQSLDAAQRAEALLSPEIDPGAFAGPGRKGEEGAPRGIAADALTGEQRALLWALIGEYAGVAHPDSAGPLLERVRADGLGALRFSWTGPWESRRDRFTYRIHGPSILIDYLRMQAVGDEPGNHIHTIIRDPRNDYGEDWLARRYGEPSASGGGPSPQPAAE